MADAPIVFDEVSKKFRRGERHDSLRDLLPALVRRAMRRRDPNALERDEFWALRNVSFEVKAGEALGIIGANGAGKSTALKVLCRILKPTSGRCAVRGRVGALIEVASGFHPDLTGRENVFLQGALMGMARAETATRFDEIVDFAGVGAFIDTPVKRYSSGMNARLGFSIAAHLNPDVLIVDEVLSVGDMAFQRRCEERMRTFLRRGVAIVFVSHNLAAVRGMCESTLLLKGGVPIAAGRTADVLRQYVAGTSDESESSIGQSQGSSSLQIVNVRAGDDNALMELHPGDELRLEVRAQTKERISRMILVTHVVEETTQVVAFNYNSPLAEIASSDDGSSVDLALAMKLNLLRGIYSLSFSLHDPETQEHLVWVRPAVMFGISEDQSYSGIADLNLRLSKAKTAESSVTARSVGGELVKCP